MSFRIQTLNNIAVAGLERFPRDAYEVASDLSRPDAILLRSFNLHDAEIPASVKAVARAGAGVNNIPVSELSRRGVPVFNTPGANANAVKELVVAGLLLAARNICAAWDFARDLSGQGEELARAVEEGKKKFAGSELPGRTLGVIGLGAIGVQVANAAHALGMRVIGYDPQITVHRAWQLSAGVEQAAGLDELFRRSDFVTPHVPLTDATRHIVNAERLAMLQPGSVLLNFAREGVVDDEAVISALDDGHLAAFVTDFPTRALLNHTRAICLPHLGASTREAEENCAVMAVDQLRDFLEHGIVRNSVNFPEVSLPQAEGYRLAVANANVPNMVGQMTTLLARADLNILDMLNRSRGELAYTVVDVDDPVPPDTVDSIAAIEGVLAVRAL